MKLPLELVQDIVNKVDRNEYKRQQAAPGPEGDHQGVRHRAPLSDRAEVSPNETVLWRFRWLRFARRFCLSQPSPREQVGR